jgi:hypothetical protein
MIGANEGQTGGSLQTTAYRKYLEIEEIDDLESRKQNYPPALPQ